MQNKYKREGDFLVLEIPNRDDFPNTLAGKADYHRAVDNRPRYRINPSDLNKFKEGERYEEGRDFFVGIEGNLLDDKLWAWYMKNATAKDNDMSKEDELWDDVADKFQSWIDNDFDERAASDVVEQELKSKYKLTPKN